MRLKNDWHFSVYEHKLVYSEHQLLTRKFIVLKDNENDIVAWTNYHQFIPLARKRGVQRISSDGGNRHNHIVQLLNYAFFDKYQIKCLNDLTVDIVRDFLNDYGLCRLPGDSENTHRSESTVNRCIFSVLEFLNEYISRYKDSKIRAKELYIQKEVYSKQKRRYVKKIYPAFEVLYNASPRTIMRDIPEKIFSILMNKIVESYPRILMLVALEAFAGLRPSEACNVRRPDSPLGPGIRFDFAEEKVTDVYIDLTKEYVLRSDLISVGKIKKERLQHVYPAFLPVFCDCYAMYMEFLKFQSYEAEFGPLTVTKAGKAYTYADYYYEFQNVVASCIPIMLSSNDPEVIHYGQLLMEHTISPHIFRHWFSVKLTLYGEDVAGLMYWRGDKSPESALTYIMNKSDLEKQFEKVSKSIFDYSLWKAGKKHDDLSTGISDEN